MTISVSDFDPLNTGTKAGFSITVIRNRIQTEVYKFKNVS
jgi:hypothetical protein